MLTETARKVLAEIATHGTARHYSPRSKFDGVVRALCSLRYLQSRRPGRYELTDAGREALAGQRDTHADAGDALGLNRMAW